MRLIRLLTCMAAAKNSVHWAPSPISSSLSDSLSQSSSSPSSFTSSSSTIQYINSQLISHGFAVPPGLSLDGLSTGDAENVTKCLLSMLSQRVVSVVVLYRWVAARRVLMFAPLILHRRIWHARRKWRLSSAHSRMIMNVCELCMALQRRWLKTQSVRQRQLVPN